MRPHELTARAAAAAIASGELSSEDLVRSCLDRIVQREPAIRAFSHLAADHALAEARDADKAVLLGHRPLGPLHGVPVAIKDMIDTSELPTEYNSTIYRGFRPAQDAACVSLLRSAGAIVLGKTETIEFAAHGRHPVTRNPRDPSRTPGGSSSGSAAAVADLMVPLTLGTQTGGSLIRPASFCGVFGMKPTFGTVSTEGAKLFSASLDTIGWYARSLDDLSLVCEVFEVSSQPAVPAPAKLNLAYCRTPYWDRASDDMRRAFESGLETLRSHGAALTELDLGREFDEINLAKEQVMRAEGRVAFLNLHRAVPEKLSPGIQARMGRNDDAPLRGALDSAAMLRIAFDKTAAQFDAVLTPAATGVAPVGLAYAGDPIFNGMWTLLHAPCLSLPVLAGEGGLPMGLQLVGARYGDAGLLAAAESILAILAA